MIDFLTKSPWGWSFETMYVLFSVFQHIGIILACQAMWWVLYHFEIPFFEQYKSVENWPWQVDAPGWRKLVYKSIFVAVFGGLYGIPLLLAPYWFKVMPIAFPLEVEKLPTPTNFFLTLVFCIMVEDFFFQIMHRIFHTKWLYNNVHKIHHEHTRVLSIGSVYAHPIEFMFGDLLPVSMGPIILDSHIHMFTVFAWFAIRNFETHEAHSGYDFPWSPFYLLPFSTGADYHTYHHSENVGNYSTWFSVWDTVLGSNKEYYDHAAEKNEAREKDSKVKS